VFLTLAPGLKVVDANYGGRPYPFTQQDDVVFLDAPAANTPQMVYLHYSGEVAAAATPGAIVLGGEVAWYPRPLQPVRAKFRLAIHLPAGYQAVAVGEPQPNAVGESTSMHHWLTRQPVPSAGVVAGQFDRVVSSGETLELCALLPHGQDPEVGQALIGFARSSVTFYGAHYGPYADSQLAVVPLDPPDQPLLSTAAVVGSDALASQNAATEAVAFAVARAWTTRASYQGRLDEQRFMREGVADYMALLYRAQRLGPVAFRQALAAAQAIAQAPEVVSSEPATDTGMPAGPTAIDRADARAIMVLHMLRHQIGNGPFDAGLKALYANPEAWPVDLGRFRVAMETAANTHLEEFFRQWLQRPGLPAFALEEVHIEARAQDRFEISGVITQELPAYFLNLPLVVRTTGRPILYNLPVRSTRTPFRLESRFRPMQILVDPLHDVLAKPLPPQNLVGLP
jgi:aminopeptidase N